MFVSVIRLFSSTAIAALALTSVAQAGEGIRLATEAVQDGYSYHWDPTENAATLARPGVQIVVRGGSIFYEVNDATPQADEAPRFDGRDLIISPRLAAHLREIAHRYPAPRARMADAHLMLPSAGAAALAVSAHQNPGNEVLSVSGTAPANAPVILTTTAAMSLDLPVVVLSRHTVVATADGAFSAEIPYGQETHFGTILTVTATSALGLTPAVSRVVVGVPSPQVHDQDLDRWPKH